LSFSSFAVLLVKRDVNLLDHFPVDEGVERYDRIPFLMFRKSGRSVARQAAVIPNPTSTVDHTAIFSM